MSETSINIKVTTQGDGRAAMIKRLRSIQANARLILRSPLDLHTSIIGSAAAIAGDTALLLAQLDGQGPA